MLVALGFFDVSFHARAKQDLYVLEMLDFYHGNLENYNLK